MHLKILKMGHTELFTHLKNIFSFQRQQVQSKRTYVSINAWAIQEFVFINAI